MSKNVIKDIWLIKLLTCLSDLAEIPEKEKNSLIKLLQVTTIRKNEHFIAVGESPDKVAFIVEGLFRIYYLSESGKENCLVFRDSGKFLSAYNYLLDNSTSKYTFQALEESVLLYVSLDDYAKLMKSDECWQQVLSKYYQLLFIEKEEREVQFLSADAKERYRCFITKYPELSNRISQYHIASYLGITPEALSRIRKQLIDVDQ
ncbi:Crp/Fnr family transcriptional regulator [Eubacteriaceae bacterium ES2]|nr:Crp/Fnr family transcriptional regulator [Eubacteriaceae bacterium ES2]